MADVGVFGTIRRTIGALLGEVTRSLADANARPEVLSAAGITPRGDVGQVSTEDVDRAAAALAGDFEDVAEAVEAVTAAIVAVEQLVRLIATVDEEDDFLEIFLRLLEVCGASRLRRREPIAFAIARMLGVLTDDLTRLDWDELGKMFERLLGANPDGERVPVGEAYVQAWFVYATILLAKGFEIDEIDWLYGWDPDPTVDHIAQDVSQRTVTVALRHALLESDDDSDALRAEVLVSSAYLPPEHRGPAVMLGIAGGVELEAGGAEVDPTTPAGSRPPGTRFHLAAPALATVLLPLAGSPEAFRIDGGPDGEADPVRFDVRRPPSATRIAFPETTRRRLEIGAIAFAGGFVGGDLAFELSVGDASIVIDPKRDDDTTEPGGELLDGPTRIPFEFSVGWTASRGVFIGGGGSPLGFTRPVPWARVRGLRFHYVRFELVPPGGAAGRALAIDATTSASLDIGGFHATVDGIGVRTKIDLDAGGELDADFLAPRGIALSIDIGSLKGGGLLLLDRDRGEYAGALDLAIRLSKGAGELKVQAVGIYTTNVAGTSDALLVSASVRGFRWELGWGFSWVGVGLLIGTNHGLDLPALRDGMRAGALDQLMFPDDVVRDAPRILQTMRTVFPIEPGSTCVAVFVELLWGAEDVARIRLGLLVRWRSGADIDELVLLGSLDLGLPSRDKPILRIQADLGGVVRWSDQLEIAIDAHLRDSHLAGVAITGSLALRLRRGRTDPLFLLSIGGFHPQFPLPPASEVPRLDRLGFRIERSRLRMSAEIYFAVASCTVQHGARLDLVARGLGLRLEATLGYDTLVDLDTGRFTVEIYARAALKRGDSTLLGLDLNLRVEGSSPNRVTGKATFKIWFVKKSIGIDETWGGGAEPVPAVDIEARLVAELSAPRNWDGGAVASGDRLITIEPLGATDGTVVVHPLADLTVRQRLLPLGLELDRLGPARPSGQRRFSITAVTGVGDDVPIDDVDDDFAVAQFLDLDEATRLSKPGFERLASGVRVRSTDLAAGRDRRRKLVYETIVIPVDHRPAPSPPRPPRLPFEILAQFSAVASTQRSVAGGESDLPPDPTRRVEFHPIRYVTATEQLTSTERPPAASYHLAAQRLRRRDLVLVESHEVL